MEHTWVVAGLQPSCQNIETRSNSTITVEKKTTQQTIICKKEKAPWQTFIPAGTH
jgi:hypothetical protein